MGSRIILAGLALAAIFAAPALAQAPPPPGNCKTAANGAPIMITGSAQASQQQHAQNNARNDWSNKASAFGGFYQSWTTAARKSTNCQSAKRAFSYVYTCTATAQPCR